MLNLGQNSIIFSIFVVVFISSLKCTPTEAYGRTSPKGNITIKWDVAQWMDDGYIAAVTIYNFQNNRQIQAPGWQLGWTWAKNTRISQHEVIWDIVGAKITSRRGDCSHFKGTIPLSCSKNPTFIDLKPNVPYNQMLANCCRGGVLKAWSHNRPASISFFEIVVGAAGTTNSTVKLPTNVVFKAPKDVYACGPAKVIEPSRYFTADGLRSTQALMTWKVTCLFTNVKKVYIGAKKSRGDNS